MVRGWAMPFTVPAWVIVDEVIRPHRVRVIGAGNRQANGLQALIPDHGVMCI
jgi:hypothetical protein